MIDDTIWQEVDDLLSLLEYACVTDSEKAKINLLIDCDDKFNKLSTECQVIYITAQILHLRGVECDNTTINYLSRLSDCNNCGLNIPDIIITPSNTLYMQGGVTKRCGC